jgi:hypothetical protein
LLPLLRFDEFLALTHMRFEDLKAVVTFEAHRFQLLVLVRIK